MSGKNSDTFYKLLGYDPLEIQMLNKQTLKERVQQRLTALPEELSEEFSTIRISKELKECVALLARDRQRSFNGYCHKLTAEMAVDEALREWVELQLKEKDEKLSP